jgi:hypothetical protein
MRWENGVFLMAHLGGKSAVLSMDWTSFGEIICLTELFLFFLHAGILAC